MAKLIVKEVQGEEGSLSPTYYNFYFRGYYMFGIHTDALEEILDMQYQDVKDEVKKNGQAELYLLKIE